MGHVAPHLAPSQVACPPRGEGQAEHEVPQEAGDLSSTHPPLQAWWPSAQEDAQRWFGLHVTLPFRTGAQSFAVQQLPEGTQAAPQRL